MKFFYIYFLKILEFLYIIISNIKNVLMEKKLVFSFESILKWYYILVDWLISHNIVSSRNDAVKLGQVILFYYKI